MKKQELLSWNNCNG